LTAQRWAVSRHAITEDLTNVTPKDLPEGGRVQYIDVAAPEGISLLCGFTGGCSVITAVHLSHERLRQDLDA
jgi:hypothetical protein